MSCARWPGESKKGRDDMNNWKVIAVLLALMALIVAGVLLTGCARDGALPSPGDAASDAGADASDGAPDLYCPSGVAGACELPDGAT
jgi:hypothetical protein